LEGHASAWPYANRMNVADVQKRIPPKETMENIYMQRAQRIILIALMLACLPCGTASAFFGATATIVDDETGEPIEGAIALAQWMKYSYMRNLLEGGSHYLTKAKETTSNKAGKIYISGYWSWIPFTGTPHLTVYKPGYALWNSKKDIIPVKDPPPKGFNRFTKVVRLVKFEKAAEEWKKIAYRESDKKYPRHLHYNFLGNCFETGLDTNVLRIDDIFYSYEDRFLMQENAQRRREYENSKKR